MSMASTGRSRGVALLFAGALGFGTFFAAAEGMTDPDRQSAAFKRIFSYDKDLRTAEKIVVLVVAESKASKDGAQVAAIFRDQGLYPAVVGVADLSDDLTATLTPGNAVLYVMPGVPYVDVKHFAEKKGLLSISGRTSLAEAGHVSVSVEVRDDHPEIVVNLPSLRGERHELSSELLNLARVIR